ncbi:hypothetical protein PHLGIDRAFT_269376 [Phlebiopsis gigantea 11061_1 CR5-6]|uniref:Uncharacterized protein n=1 Tax=Phlebiopsis gigantea (strain 11061_1 CR5-6) TaxID=745531 RepID=A0A0C3S4H6_PHLG1|nr:hypothetical protein PHLGIDRAFT_269376 [Phlebiopsis gigantea 11061_1 CR5-6]
MSQFTCLLLATSHCSFHQCGHCASVDSTLRLILRSPISSLSAASRDYGSYEHHHIPGNKSRLAWSGSLDTRRLVACHFTDIFAAHRVGKVTIGMNPTCIAVVESTRQCQRIGAGPVLLYLNVFTTRLNC